MRTWRKFTGTGTEWCANGVAGREMSQARAVAQEPRGERAVVALGLMAVAAISWAYLVWAAMDMQGAMQGPARWMMVANWDAPYFALVFMMWVVMMAAMMLPSAAPVILLYGAVLRRSAEPTAGAQRLAQSYVFAGGYGLAWTGFSALATLLQFWLSRAALLSPMMIGAGPLFGATLLILAGLYQWTPLKRACLVSCRSPLAALVGRWRPGLLGAARMGFGHGIDCVGCCWALMALLFVGGVMNLGWIAAISVFVLAEKLMPFGAESGRWSGTALIATGLWTLSRA